MSRNFSYLKHNFYIVKELKKRGIIGKYLFDSANASFYISKNNPNNIIKVFNCYNFNDIIERKNDFINEIEVLKFLQKTLEAGIIQIKDSNSFEIHNTLAIYYEMLKYEVYDKNKSIANILNDFRYLFSVLGRIHSLGYIHLDIKPDNIMTYMDKPVIIDFGCAQKKSSKIKLPKGPKWFKPPELLNRLTGDENFQYDIDYEKSDIYMLSKTFWAVLQNDMWEKGFYGDYNRNYLHDIKGKINGNCEPLNLLFENTIITDWEQRLNIQECIKLLDNQIKILNNEYYESGIENEQYVNYDLLERLHAEKPNILVYEDCTKIERIVRVIKKIKINRIKINRMRESIEILDLSVSDFGKELLKPATENHYVIKYNNKSINIVINRINVYEPSKNQEIIKIELGDGYDFKNRFTLLTQFSAQEVNIIGGAYYLDSKHEIIVELNNNDEKLSINSLFK